ncbi:MAG: hypothetical protein KIT20_11765 [Alphaproteobacteria bacterium]|nr:hypothetical protein [Alphaproteobacteria bacterium]
MSRRLSRLALSSGLLLAASGCLPPPAETPASRPPATVPEVAAADTSGGEEIPGLKPSPPLEWPVWLAEERWPGGEARWNPPPVGRVFHAQRGGFTVVETGEDFVVTANFQNVTARWHGGLHAAPEGVEIDGADLVRIWPLRVGKRTLYRARRGSDEWEITLRVVAEEPFTIGSEMVRTLVIESLVRALSPAQGGFELRRRVWYSPDYRWLLRMEDRQLAGPKATLQSWRIVEVTDRR